VLAGLVDPSDGEVEVAGFASDDPEMRRQLGFLPEESPLYEEMTPLSYLRFFADLYDVPRRPRTSGSRPRSTDSNWTTVSAASACRRG